MNCVRDTNEFFINAIYSFLPKIAFFPVNGLNKIIQSQNSNSKEILLAMALTPILAVETILTSAIALCLAVISAFLHGLTLSVAAIVDACPSHNRR